MKDLAELAIVIPVRNRKELTRACLRALAAQTVQTFGVVIVDDGSTDGTREMLRDEFPDVVLLLGDGDLWWAKATNVGVEHALARGARRIMTMNDDTVPPPEFIERMLDASRREPRAIVGALFVDVATGRVVYGGETNSWLRAKAYPLVVPPAERRGLHEVTHYPGRGVLFPAEVFAKVGLYAADVFPQTLADVDLTHRAARAGYRIFCDYDAPLGIYPEESGDVQIRKKKSLASYKEHLFGRKGGADLRRFVAFGLRNCPWRYLPVFIFVGIVRRLIGYPRDWILERLARRASPA